jgi:hypothetical protein
MMKTYTPRNSPLLRTHNSPTLTRLRQLRNINRNLRGADPHRDPINESPRNKLPNTKRGTCNNAPNAPNHSADLDCAASTECISYDSRGQRAEEGPAGHRRGDSALGAGCWAGAFSVRVDAALVEEAFVLLGAKADTVQLERAAWREGGQ